MIQDKLLVIGENIDVLMFISIFLNFLGLCIIIYLVYTSHQEKKERRRLADIIAKKAGLSIKDLIEF